MVGKVDHKTITQIHQAFVRISNECEGVILDLDVDSLGSFTQYDTSFSILPCAPPVCNITNTNIYQTCLSGEQALVVWEWENQWCTPQSVTYWNEEGWGSFTQPVPVKRYQLWNVKQVTDKCHLIGK